jgi:hypothetical protein
MLKEKEIEKITIRPAHYSDIERLKFFFVKAYGKQTVFQSETFLKHYFDASLNHKPPFGNCLVGINEKGEIITHYGGLQYHLKINNQSQSLIWGVNAYTLPEYRGKGLNSKIVEYINENFDINGVIGFTQQTAAFYQKIGYNLFNFEKFSRHVLVLDYEKTVAIGKYIGQNPDKINDHKPSQQLLTVGIDFGTIIKLTSENIDRYQWKLEDDFVGITTTHRTKAFLKWRFLENPFIKYTLFGVIQDGHLLAYIALREEVLNPFTSRVNRIIDLFGASKAVALLLQKTIHESVSKQHIYIDFSKFGAMYDLDLQKAGFIELKEDDSCILPMVTSPIENRPNREYLGIMSKMFTAEVNRLSHSNVYFTRMDSDRDRLATINQTINQTDER